MGNDRIANLLLFYVCIPQSDRGQIRCCYNRSFTIKAVKTSIKILWRAFKWNFSLLICYAFFVLTRTIHFRCRHKLTLKMNCKSILNIKKKSVVDLLWLLRKRTKIRGFKLSLYIYFCLNGLQNVIILIFQRFQISKFNL